MEGYKNNLYRNRTAESINPLNAELNPICHLLALVGTHRILHVSRVRVNLSHVRDERRPLTKAVLNSGISRAAEKISAFQKSTLLRVVWHLGALLDLGPRTQNV